MKDVTFEIELTTHMVANGTDTDGRTDRFQRDAQGNLIFQQAWWFTAFRDAIEMEHLRGVRPGDICMDLSVNAPDTITYDRKYGRGNIRKHEAVPAGAHVRFNAVVADHITESTLRRLLWRIGSFIGLSPYGHRLGYGHFNLIELTVDKSEVAKTVVEGA